MSLIKRDQTRTWDPFKELEEMSSRLNRVFARPMATDDTLKGFDFAPAINVSETPTAYMIKAELPGVKKEDIKVTLERGVLTVSGERKTEQEHKDEKIHRVESSYGSFMRRMSLPEDASAEGIEANHRDGVLSVKIAKHPAEKKPEAKRIPIS